MDFAFDDKTEELRARMTQFMDEFVYPAEPAFHDSASHGWEWGFALYLTSKNGWEDQSLPTGFTAGTPEEALDCAASLYLGNP